MAAPITGALLLGSVLTGQLAPRTQAQSMQVVEQMEHRSWFSAHSRAFSYLGVDLGDIDQDRAQALHLKEARGAEITVLDHDAPAGKIGLKLHDVILQADQQTIDNAEQLKRFLREFAPGHKMQLVISRDGAQQTVTVQLADRRKIQEEARQEFGPTGGSPTGGNTLLTGGGDVSVPSGMHIWSMGSSLHIGALVEPLSPQMQEFLGVANGVMIKSVARKSSADAAGLKPHDVILGIGGELVATSSDWERILRSAEGKPVQVEIMRDHVKQLVLLQVDGKRHKE